MSERGCDASTPAVDVPLAAGWEASYARDRGTR